VHTRLLDPIFLLHDYNHMISTTHPFHPYTLLNVSSTVSGLTRKVKKRIIQPFSLPIRNPKPTRNQRPNTPLHLRSFVSSQPSLLFLLLRFRRIPVFGLILNSSGCTESVNEALECACASLDAECVRLLADPEAFVGWNGIKRDETV